MRLNQQITFKESVFVQEVDGEMVLLDMNSENYFGLDTMGAIIWQIMKEEKALDRVYESLLERYEVMPDILEKDLLEFVRQLRENRLIEGQSI